MGHTQVSELYSSFGRQTQDKLCKYQTLVPTRSGNMYGTHTTGICRMLALKKKVLILKKNTLGMNAGSPPFDVTFLVNFGKQ